MCAPRHCVICLREIPGGKSTQYCDEDRIAAQRKSWRESKRRSYARSKTAALEELRRAVA